MTSICATRFTQIAQVFKSLFAKLFDLVRAVLTWLLHMRCCRGNLRQGLLSLKKKKNSSMNDVMYFACPENWRENGVSSRIKIFKTPFQCRRHDQYPRGLIHTGSPNIKPLQVNVCWIKEIIQKEITTNMVCQQDV